MGLTLEAVQFNHDPTSAEGDAINLRRNATQFVTVPEWRRGACVNPEDSPAAYALRETQGNPITIRAQFRYTGRAKHLQIRAIDPQTLPPPGLGCAGLLLWILLKLFNLIYGNVLGEVRARPVTIPPGGLTGLEPFTLRHVRMWSVGVGSHTTLWRWQYREHSHGSWTTFQETRHRIYTILEVPKAPWQQTPYDASNLQLPWTEALDRACDWAVLSFTRDDAAARVTRAVYELGPATVTYDCPGGGSTHYSLGGFNLTAFLDRLRGGPGLGIYVNCTDCATILSTFANVLGCDLWQSRMSGTWSFDLNELLAIGSNTWQTACGWGGFSYHEVAWKDACTAADNIFDACLQVDGDADPTTAPHTPLLPTNLLFGNPGDGTYRDRLATPTGRPNCNPQPSTRQRRAVY